MRRAAILLDRQSRNRRLIPIKRRSDESCEIGAMQTPADPPIHNPQRDLVFDPALVRKYDGFGPRYTSYPTADRFHDAFGPDDYLARLRERNATRPTQPL